MGQDAGAQSGSQTSAFFFFLALELFGLRMEKWVSPQHPREAAEDGREANMYVTLGLMVGRGPKMSFSSMQTVYSCKKSQLLNPGFSGQKLISSDVISEFPFISVGNC